MEEAIVEIKVQICFRTTSLVNIRLINIVTIPTVMRNEYSGKSDP